MKNIAQMVDAHDMAGRQYSAHPDPSCPMPCFEVATSPEVIPHANESASTPLPDFSRALSDMFEAATTTSLEEFPAALLRVVKRHLVFDGAVVGHADPLCYGEFSIAVAHVHQREQSILEEYKDLSAADPVTQAFLAGLVEPLAVDTERFYRAPRHAAMKVFSRKHRLRHLLLCGYPPSQNQRGRWVVLYRTEDRPFDAASVQWFGAFCLHLDRALDLNRAKALDRLPPPSRRKAVGLIDQDGRVEMADSLFGALLKSEFRHPSPHRLPGALELAMRQGHAFEGRVIRGTFESLGAHHLCELREKGPLGQLSPRETLAARRFAQGCNSREIAVEMGVSLSTVQSQLASVYRKLGVTGKAGLVRIFADSEG